MTELSPLASRETSGWKNRAETAVSRVMITLVPTSDTVKRCEAPA